MIEKSNYEEGLKEVIDKQKKNTIDFLLSTKVFINFDPQSLVKIFPNFIFEKIVKNTIIILEDQEPMYIYFIKSGEFEITINNSIAIVNKKLAVFGGAQENDVQEEEEYICKSI